MTHKLLHLVQSNQRASLSSFWNQSADVCGPSIWPWRTSNITQESDTWQDIFRWQGTGTSFDDKKQPKRTRSELAQSNTEMKRSDNGLAANVVGKKRCRERKKTNKKTLKQPGQKVLTLSYMILLSKKHCLKISCYVLTNRIILGQKHKRFMEEERQHLVDYSIRKLVDKDFDDQ